MRLPRALLVVAAAVAVGVAGSSTWAQTAPSVTILDLSDGTPTVTVGDWQPNQPPKITTDPEYALVAGVLPVLPNGNLPAPGLRAVLLMEPDADIYGPRVSDVVVLGITYDTAGAPVPSASIEFWSDGWKNADLNLSFADIVKRYADIAIQVPETVVVQDLSHDLNSGYLTIKVQSDFTSSEVPDGGVTAGLLGLGLLSLAALRRR
jgi:hypothetical protein